MSNRIVLQQDANGVPIQTLRPRPAGGHKIDFTLSSVRNGTAFSPSSGFVELWATQDCFIRFGDTSVAAAAGGGDKFLPANQWSPPYPLKGATHVAAIRAGATNGSLYVSEMD